MKNIYAYKIVVKSDFDSDDSEYYTDRGIIWAQDMEEGVHKVSQYFKGTSEKVVTIELDEIEDTDTIIQDGCFSVYGFLADVSMFNDITHEIKGWHLIKD